MNIGWLIGKTPIGRQDSGEKCGFQISNRAGKDVGGTELPGNDHIIEQGFAAGGYDDIRRRLDVHRRIDEIEQPAVGKQPEIVSGIKRTP